MEDRHLELQSNLLMRKYERLEAEYQEVLDSVIDPSKPPIKDDLRAQARIMAQEQALKASQDKPEGTDSDDAGDDGKSGKGGEDDDQKEVDKPKVPFEEASNEDIFGEEEFDNSIQINHVKADKIKEIMRGLDIKPPSWATHIDDEKFQKMIDNINKKE